MTTMDLSKRSFLSGAAAFAGLSSGGIARALGQSASLVLHNGRIISLDRDDGIYQAIAIREDRVLATGSSQEMLALAAPDARRIDLQGKPVIPGLIDGHAHADRAGLRNVLPSLDNLTSIADILDKVAAEVAKAKPGAWLVFDPIGIPPDYAGLPNGLRDKRMPTRWDLDAVSPRNPVYIRPPWGYWPNEAPLRSVANSLALKLANITRDTPSPTPLVVIDKDPKTGEPTGLFLEDTREPIVEFTLMSAAPSFTPEMRQEALVQSMGIYNGFGTTSVFEGHGAAPEVIAAFQQVYKERRQTLRANLVFSPNWSKIGQSDIDMMLRSWAEWLGRRGLGDHWLRVADIYTEIDSGPETKLRALTLPHTGWAGYSPDVGLPRAAVLDLMMEAARNDVRIAGIWANLLPMYQEVDKRIPLAGKRWVLGHQRTLDKDQIAIIKDLGLVLTTHTNRHIYKEGALARDRLGPGKEDTIVPLRTLQEAGVPVGLGTDGDPPSLFQPIWSAAERVDRRTGEIISPRQKLTRLEALKLATQGGAYLSFEEGEKGSLDPGKLADLVVTSDDPLTVEASKLSSVVAETTLVGGRIVYARSK